MLRPVFLGTGHYLPEKIVTNDDLAKLMDTSDEWIQQRTGIKTRRYVDFENDPMGASELGARAAQNAMDDAGVSKDEIDLIVHATLSSDHEMPGDGVLIQAKLDIPVGVPAIDIRAQCSGFIYALSTADAFIRTGRYKKVLVIGAEVHSTGIDFSDEGRDIAVLFGDGAGAVVLGVEDGVGDDGIEHGILDFTMHSDGRHFKDLWIEYPASAEESRLTAERLKDKGQFPSMNGRAVFKHAVTRMPEAIRTVLERQNLKVEDLDLVIPHQANLRISEMLQRKLKLRDDQIFNNIMHYGNTTAATIPIALSEARAQGRVKKGDLIALTAFGAGFTWGSVLIRW